MGASVRMEKGDTKVNAIQGPSFPRRVSSQWKRQIRGGDGGYRQGYVAVIRSTDESATDTTFYSVNIRGTLAEITKLP